MKEAFIKTRNNSIKLGYKYLLKPALFMQDPEKVHDRFTIAGEKLASNKITKSTTNLFFNYSNPVLSQKILGINFINPVGLAAGFDKDARLTDIIPKVGFGFEEIGSITGQKCLGNPKPRLWRLKKSKSLVVYYGLKNDGAEDISKRLKDKSFDIPILTSIAKTNSKETVNKQAGIKDYAKAYDLMKSIGSISVINISCPNAYGGQPFHDRESLDNLLKEIKKIKSKKPIFLKISPDLTKQQIDNIIDLCHKYEIKGLICSNLTKNKNNPKIIDNDIPKVGGISGKPTEDISNELIKYVYKKTQGKLIIIGVGGIFNAEDAYKKIRYGASLVQLITGMIFIGPQVISEINQGLVKLLKKDGFNNISQAIGIDAKY
ncbi:dihydroorotate dehydrogenase (quinone) [Candidatus Pacearchaeota archaeon CG1_02_32_21]|nr:MAG: dihydroorotate dehydrogenase (quinone) [Candidatus Pacearchaeota archaeon CG1_02_32_21]